MKIRFGKTYVYLAEYRMPILRARLARRLGLESTPVIVPGERHHPGHVHAVFLIWQPQATAWYVTNALEALAEAGINVTLVVNHPLSEARLAELRPFADRIMLRDNSGRDMGGYRDAILSFAGREPERLLLMNDSVYYFRTGLAEMVHRLATSPCDVCATYENWEYHHHFQSFCYSISRYMLEKPAFQQFWRDYLPVNARPWAISKGEVGSSRRMLRLARSTEVLFTPAKLREALAGIDSMGLQDLFGHLPIDLRPAQEGPRTRQERVLRQLTDAVVVRSQIHTGGFLYRRFLRAPLIKRDLLFRLQYQLHEIESLLNIVGAEGHTADIITEMRAKGIGFQLRGRARQRFLLDL
ncbi:rhamnan synthesis F family protein [Ancylobacter sp.]|uniref:rhamnan synthesis F family protein n=1 Tax=Ancylobacter sp. TaxID=1872567 RepID=UPI003C7D22A2